MQNEKMPEVMTVEGPEGLMAALNSLYEKTHLDPSLPTEYYLLYRLGGQKSLIKVDMKAEPTVFWYSDLLGRPATQLVKDTINQFLLSKFGEHAGSNA